MSVGAVEAQEIVVFAGLLNLLTDDAHDAVCFSELLMASGWELVLVVSPGGPWERHLGVSCSFTT